MLLGRITPCLGICLLNWHISKKTTMGSAILMGRVTFDGMNRRCLPGRETLILTRDKDFDCEGVTTVTSVEEA